MTDGRDDHSADGRVLTPARQGDVLAIQDLAISYGHAVDDRDWPRWEALFLPDARIDYTSAGGVAGTPAELAAWMPDAMAAFTYGMHSISTHEIRFVDATSARGRVHLFNRNGVEWEGEAEVVDVGAVYEDSYRLVGDAWRFAARIERVQYIVGGHFAAMVRDLAAAAVGGDAQRLDGG